MENIPVTNTTIDFAYQHVKSITRFYAKTFYFASHFLPKEKRLACFALYGFCRYIDDTIDDLTPEEAQSKGLEILNQWQKATDFIYDKKISSEGSPEDKSDESIFIADLINNNPILLAWQDTLLRYNIPRELPFELIKGVLMDTQQNRFSNFDELYEYCYKVASVVGLMTSEIFGYSNAKALPHAIDLGIAMQLTNICRDIGEDCKKNRLYLPLDECNRFGVSVNDIFDLKRTQNLVDLLEFQINRALKYYDSADKGIPYLTKDSRLTVHLMSSNYRRILFKIRKNSYDVFSRRASLSVVEKLFAVPRALIRNFAY